MKENLFWKNSIIAVFLQWDVLIIKGLKNIIIILSFPSVFSDNFTEKRCLLWSVLIKPPSILNLVLSPAATLRLCRIAPQRWGVDETCDNSEYLRFLGLQPWHDVLENHVKWFFPIGCGIWWLEETQMCISKPLQYHNFFFLRQPKKSTRKSKLLNIVLSFIFHS